MWNNKFRLFRNGSDIYIYIYNKFRYIIGLHLAMMVVMLPLRIERISGCGCVELQIAKNKVLSNNKKSKLIGKI
jgi:hypothetical protein